MKSSPCLFVTDIILRITFYIIMTETHQHCLLLERTSKERVKGIVKLTAPHFSHSSHCEVSNTRCLTVQHARIPLQVKYCLQHLILGVKFTKSLNKSCHSPSFGSTKLMCLKVSGAAGITWVGHVLRAHFCVMLYLHEPMFRFSSNITFELRSGCLTLKWRHYATPKRR